MEDSIQGDPLQLAELPFPKLDFALTDVSIQVPRHSHSDQKVQLSLEAVTLSNMKSNLDLGVALNNLKIETLNLTGRSWPTRPVMEVTSIEVDVSIRETMVVKADVKPINITLDTAEYVCYCWGGWCELYNGLSLAANVIMIPLLLFYVFFFNAMSK